MAATKLNIFQTGFSSSHIDGLYLIWYSNTQIKVSTGSAYIPGYSGGSVKQVTSEVGPTTVPSIAASTWYHVYLYDNSGTATLDISTTVPDAPYNGYARIKTGDNTRRYIGTIKTNSSSQLYKFQMQGYRFVWREKTGSDFRVLSGGAATTGTTVSLSVGVPVTTQMAFLRVINIASPGAGTGVSVSSNDEIAALPTEKYVSVGDNGNAFLDVPTDSLQRVAYAVNLATAVAYIDLYGFTVVR